MNVTAYKSSFTQAKKRSQLDGKLAAYVAACGTVGTMLATRADAAVISNHSVQPFGIDEEVNIDFDGDGQIDYQIDHDRVNLNGTDLDYLQIDKNDVSSPADPISIDIFSTFPLGPDGPGSENDTFASGYVTDAPTLGLYPSALTYGTPIGGGSNFDFSETDDSNGGYLRANRLIDEDMGQIDAFFALPVDPLPGTPNFVGLGGAVRYLGVKMDFQNTFDGVDAVHYGWIGIEITDEADATGNVVGWGYQTIPGHAIGAGVPEPSSLVLGAIGGAALIRYLVGRRK
jgi:hypothetical protein